MGGLITFTAVVRGGTQLPGSDRNRRKKERIRKEGKGPEGGGKIETKSKRN